MTVFLNGKDKDTQFIKTTAVASPTTDSVADQVFVEAGKPLRQYVVDASGVGTPSALPTDKSLRDIIGTAYVDAAGADASLENIQEHLVAGLHAGGAASDLPAGKALYDIIGSAYVDGGGVFQADSVWDDLRTIAQRIIDGTAGGEAGATLPAGKSIVNIVGTEYVDADGIPEVDNIRAHIYKTGGMGGGVVSKIATLDAMVVGTDDLFTVSGLVIVKILAVITDPLVSAGAATVSVGVTGSTASILPVTAYTNLATDNTFWVDTAAAATIAPLDDALRSYATSASIFLTLAGANMTTGQITFYCFWTPLSSGATVTAAA